MEKNRNMPLFKYGLLFLFVLLFVGIRFFEQTLFYDPFLIYFKNDYLEMPFPEFDLLKLGLSTVSRYVLNSVISLMVIYVLFKDLSLLKFTGFLYASFGLILFLVFICLLNFGDQNSNFVLFYVRRFLIQPLFLVLFIPAFYFQKRQI
ncbi:exosortase F system-associated membrane protein [Flavobacterium sp.]|uniref:exosortase F system-associated membrane protein n=1 Tax=Flavobacterium sp. TaxID=239 RepID=UPI002FD94F0D